MAGALIEIDYNDADVRAALKKLLAKLGGLEPVFRDIGESPKSSDHPQEELSMSQVRAKFKVNSITRQPGWNDLKEIHTIELTPVTGNSEENKRFYAATPSGSIKLSVVKGEVGKQFDLNDEFYVDFTKAEQGNTKSTWPAPPS